MDECDYCSREHDSVRLRPDPYALRVHDVNVLANVCDPCNEGRERDASAELNGVNDVNY